MAHSTQNKTWHIGDVKVTRLVEHAMTLRVDGFFHVDDISKLEAHKPWLKPHFLDENDRMILSFHALIVESQGKRIMVDTCLGNDRELPMRLGVLDTPFLQHLEEIAPREAFDYVLCTHLHFDHVGWNTYRDGDKWLPTFPNAQYLFADKEYEHWQATKEEDPVVKLGVEPIIDAGLHKLVPTDYALTDEVRLVPTHGHTPGHVSVIIESKGARAFITGDMTHHPVQIAEPHWASKADGDAEAATKTRRQFIEACGGDGTLVIGTHYSGPSAGHIRKSESGYWFEAEEA